MEEEKIEAPEITTETQDEVPAEFKKSNWIAEQILKSPLKSIFLMLMIAISTMGTVTIFFYNKQSTQIEVNNQQYIKMAEKQEKEAIEYKQHWIDCMEEKVEKIDRMQKITEHKPKKRKK